MGLLYSTGVGIMVGRAVDPYKELTATGDLCKKGEGRPIVALSRLGLMSSAGKSFGGRVGGVGEGNNSGKALLPCNEIGLPI